MNKKKYSHIDKDTFDKLKKTIEVMRDANIPFKQIEEITGRGNSTVYMIHRHDDYESYRQYTQDRAAKIREQRAKKNVASEPVAETTTAPQEENQQLRIVSDPASFDFKLLNDNIVLMARKLDKLNEALEKLTIAVYADRKVHMEQNKRKFF